ncbi:hypothetical protein FRB94_003034, partial [Tulasnella sp. JGI-2019a]
YEAMTVVHKQYKTTAKIDKDDKEQEQEQGNDKLAVCIFFQHSGNWLTNPFTLETLSWLLNNVHTPSFSAPVSLKISGIAYLQAIMHTIDQLSSAIKNLEFALDDASSAKAILSYLAKPFKVVVGEATTLRWPLPNLTELFFKQHNDLELEIVVTCI